MWIDDAKNHSFIDSPVKKGEVNKQQLQNDIQAWHSYWQENSWKHTQNVKEKTVELFSPWWFGVLNNTTSVFWSSFKDARWYAVFLALVPPPPRAIMQMLFIPQTKATKGFAFFFEVPWENLPNCHRYSHDDNNHI